MRGQLNPTTRPLNLPLHETEENRLGLKQLLIFAVCHVSRLIQENKRSCAYIMHAVANNSILYIHSHTHIAMSIHTGRKVYISYTFP